MQGVDRTTDRRIAYIGGRARLDSSLCQVKMKWMPANTCEFLVGRLMEIRVGRGYRSVDDVDEMIAMMEARVRSLPPELRYVVAADWRNVTVMSPETAARARSMLSKSNSRVERSSILTLSDQSLMSLQVERLVREAENENRRHFVSAREQYSWLAEVLTKEEAVRLAEFLGLKRSLIPR